MSDDYQVAVDFMDMTDDRRVWTRATDARNGVELSLGCHVVVGDDDADPKVAKVVGFDDEGNVHLEVLPGTIESHAHLLSVR